MVNHINWKSSITGLTRQHSRGWVRTVIHVVFFFLVATILNSCKTSRVGQLNNCPSTESYIKANSQRNPLYRNPYLQSAPNGINADYVLNPLDIIEISIVHNGSPQNIQDLTVGGTKLFGNVTSIRLPRSHTFFNTSINSNISTEVNIGGVVVQLNAPIKFANTDLFYWKNIMTKLESINSGGAGSLKVRARLLPQVDCIIYPGMELQTGYSNRLNYWPDATGDLVEAPFETNWYKTSVTESGYIQLPVIYNPSLINDNTADNAPMRTVNGNMRGSLTQAPSLLNVKRGTRYMSLSELTAEANKYFQDLHLEGNTLRVKYPDLSYLNLQPVGLTWSFAYKGEPAAKVPFENGALLIASTRKLYEQNYLRRLKRNANIFLSVFPADPSEATFCINIKNNKRDIVVRPGDRVVLSLSRP